MKLELERQSDISLLDELSALKKSPSLQHPSTSPSLRSPMVGSVLQKLESENSTDGIASETASSSNEDPSFDNATQPRSYRGVRDDGSDKAGWIEISLGKTDTAKPMVGWERRFSVHSNRARRGTKITDNSVHDKEKSSRDGATGVIDSGYQKSLLGSQSTGKIATRVRDIKQGKGQRGRKLHFLASPCSERQRLHVAFCHGLKISSRERQVSSTGHSNADELEISELPQGTNVSGIHWTRSQIHSCGRNFLDIAGKRLSCGASDPVLRKAYKAKYYCSHGSTPLEAISATTSEYSDTSLNTNSESLPLLDPASLLDSGSQTEGGINEHHHIIPVESPMVSHQATNSKHAHQSSLNKKYMPKCFHDIVGQNLTTQALSNALIQRRVAHMYIFYGPRGTGKTSCARVFASALNCLSSSEQRPCGTCMGCLAAMDSQNVPIFSEFHAGSNNGVKNIKSWIAEVVLFSSYFRVLSVDECQVFAERTWNKFLNIIENAPRNLVFILCTSNLEQLPHSVVSRCQKFLFTKIKESDIINRLKSIAVLEGLEMDEAAFKLIASACDGSLRDAEMMLDQLSLLGQKISLSMVQELMGIIPNEKLLELLDFSLSADTINTVKSLKEFIVSGIEPLSLMSQLACLITSILSGGFCIPNDMEGWKFFKNSELTKEDLGSLRQALKTLSEAQKQLGSSADRTMWLTATLLQLAPDQSFLLSSSTISTSVTQSPTIPSLKNDTSSSCMKSSLDGCSSSRHRHSISKAAEGDNSFADPSLLQSTLTSCVGLEEVWQRLLDAMHSNSLRKFLQTHGKLLFVSLYKGFAVAVLEFSGLEHTSRAERSKTSIEHAFQVTLGYPVQVKVHLASGSRQHDEPSTSATRASVKHSHNIQGMIAFEPHVTAYKVMTVGAGKDGPPCKHELEIKMEDVKMQGLHKRSDMDIQDEGSLGYVVQQEGYEENDCMHLTNDYTENPSIGNVVRCQRSDRTHSALQHDYEAAALKLGQENLRLESRAHGLLCWHGLDKSNGKGKQLPQSPRKSGIFLTLCPCTKSKHYNTT